MRSVSFNRYYTALPPSYPAHPYPRTFIILPPKDSPSFSSFLPAQNGLAPDELQAHTGMFSAKTNDGYYELGLETSKIIREAVNIGRGLVQDEETEAASGVVAKGAMNDKIETSNEQQESMEAEEAKEFMQKESEKSEEGSSQEETPQNV